MKVTHVHFYMKRIRLSWLFNTVYTVRIRVANRDYILATRIIRVGRGVLFFSAVAVAPAAPDLDEHTSNTNTIQSWCGRAVMPKLC